MSGILVPILKMTEYDFSFLAGSSSQTKVLHPALNVASYYGRLIVRVHETNIAPPSAGPSGTISIAGYGTDPSAEDPQEFTLSSQTFSASVDDGNSSGDLVSATASDLWPFLKIVVEATQGAGSGDRLYAVISADLLLREA
jgi:hypothetical protein